MSENHTIKARFVIDPNAKNLTADIFCRTFLGKSEAAFVRELQIYGLDYLLEKTKKSTDEAGHIAVDAHRRGLVDKYDMPKKE